MKKWYQSKTVWLNVAAGVATLVAAVTQVLPNLEGLMDTQTYTIVNAVVVVSNLMLRKYFTSTAIE